MVDFTEGRQYPDCDNDHSNRSIDIPTANTMIIDQADRFDSHNSTNCEAESVYRERATVTGSVPGEAALDKEAQHDSLRIQKFTELAPVSRCQSRFRITRCW